MPDPTIVIDENGIDVVVPNMAIRCELAVWASDVLGPIRDRMEAGTYSEHDPCSREENIATLLLFLLDGYAIHEEALRRVDRHGDYRLLDKLIAFRKARPDKNGVRPTLRVKLWASPARLFAARRRSLYSFPTTLTLPE